MQKYYKAFSRELKCRGFQFEEGKVYEVEGPPVLCSHGFHFCQDLVLTLEYYPVEKCITENRYAEVETLGECVYEEPTKHKGCTNKIKIVRLIPDEEVLAMADSNSGNWNSGNRNSGNRNSGDYNSGHSNSGDHNSGNWNSGNWNSGDRNSGDYNSGHFNSGDRNSGNRNSGDYNSGDYNSGDYNSGDRNSGNWNSGDRNSGNRNSGDYNSGDYNSGDYNSGHFNSETPDTVRVFNKEIPRRLWDIAIKPIFLRFEIHPELGYKGSFQKAYDEATDEDKALLLELPGFDSDVFFEISGIRVETQ